MIDFDSTYTADLNYSNNILKHIETVDINEQSISYANNNFLLQGVYEDLLLKSLYNTNNILDIQKYLSTYPYLLTALVKAQDTIVNKFKNCECSLSFEKADEYYSDILVIEIKTNLDPKEAVNNLIEVTDKLEQNFPDIDEDVIFTLDYYV